jgi:hypothetical protein
LKSESYYTVYVYLENLIGENSGVAFFEQIETVKRYPASSFSLRFFTNYINREDEKDITNALKLIFSLPDWRLIIKNDDPDRHL